MSKENRIYIDELINELNKVPIETLIVIRQKPGGAIPLRLNEKSRQIKWEGKIIRAGTINSMQLSNVTYAIYDLEHYYGVIVLLPLESNSVTIIYEDSFGLAVKNGIVIEAILNKDIPILYDKKLEVIIIPALIMKIIGENAELIMNSL